MTIWATGASTPCIAAFKPTFFGITNPPVFDNDRESHAYWLKREHIHRAIIAGLINADVFRARRDELEASWIEEESRLFSNGTPENGALSIFAAKASSQEQALIDEFYCDGWQTMLGKSRFSRYWQKQNLDLK